jgi:hypothetical protein
VAQAQSGVSGRQEAADTPRAVMAAEQVAEATSGEQGRQGVAQVLDRQLQQEQMHTGVQTVGVAEVGEFL